MFLLFLFPGCMLWMPFALVGMVWAAYRYLSAPLQIIFGVGLAVSIFLPLNHWPAAMESWWVGLVVLEQYIRSGCMWCYVCLIFSERCY